MNTHQKERAARGGPGGGDQVKASGREPFRTHYTTPPSQTQVFATALAALPEAARAAALQALQEEFARDPTEPEPQPVLTWAQVAKVFGSVTWAWPRWVPRGHLTLIVGPQGTGKSFLAARLIGCLTGDLEEWPDGAPVEGGGPVLLVETEQMRGDYADRMRALGVDLHHVFHPSEDVYDVLSLPRDLERLRLRAEFVNATAIVIDSLSGGNSMDENSAEMRHVLAGLAGLAARLAIPVIAVHHLRKRSQFEPDRPDLDRVRGSSTITQFARSVLALWRPEGGPDGPVRVEPLKCTFCKPPEALGFEITGDGLVFGEAPEEARQETERERAADFLLAMLEDGPRAAAALREEAELAGYSWSTVRRAKDALRIVSVRRDGRWLWSLPHR